MKLDRRELLFAIGLLATTMPAFAGSSKSKFEYIPSKIGIDYRTLAPSPLAEILSQGEREWMKNAKVDYEEDTAGAWSEEIAPQVATGAISKATIENLREFTPQMLQQFAVGLNPQDPKYGYLQSVGGLFVSEKLVTRDS